MKIIITGGLGHIGSRLIRDLPLLLDELEITIIDNLLTQRYTSLFNLPETSKVNFIEADIISHPLTELFQQADSVIHLAAITDAARSFTHPEEMESVNFAASKQVIDTCINTQTSLILLSSTSVYGTEQTEIDEYCSSEELKAQTPYAATKLLEEALVSEKCQRGDLQAMIFRFGTIFGISPGMRFHTAVNKFCWQAVMGTPLSIWKTAYEQQRPYLGLNDAVNAIAFILKKQLFDGQVYNAVSINATVHEVINEIQHWVPDIHLDFVDNQAMNTLSYKVLNTRLSQAGMQLGQHTLAQGVSDTIHLLHNKRK
jgi:UDP-glucose 4-epimerase